MGRGQLVFKGEEKDRKKKKSKSKHSHPSGTINRNDQEADKSQKQNPALSRTSTAVAPLSSQQQQQFSAAPATQQPQIKQGTGQITTSGIVITGYDTKFERELNIGDAILVDNEMRVVTIRLSNTSLSVSSSFSNSHPHPVKFQYITKPRAIQAKKDTMQSQQNAIRELTEVQRHAFDTYATDKNASEVVYKERTEHGSYRIKKEKIKKDSSEVTRSALLEMRSKKTSDKYC